MCVGFFTLDHPDFALILCSNRDEYLSRPSKPACFHSFGREFSADILSGIDLQAGGTWLGLTRTGKLGLITNITEPYRTFTSSRGHLLSSFLASPSSRSLENDARKIVPPDAQYAGFNLVLLEATPTSQPSPTLSFDTLFVTNHGGGGPITYRPLTTAQRHRSALSNGIDGQGTAEWPKVEHGIRALDALLDALPPDTSDDELTERLFDLLTWVPLTTTIIRSLIDGSCVTRWRPWQPLRDRSELRNTIQVEPFYAAHDVYGTRLSTVVLVRRTGQVVFTERDRWQLSEQGRPTLADPSLQRVFRFKIEKDELSK